MKNGFRSYFSPNLMDREDLEMLFVQREALAKQIIESITDSVSTPSKHYTLLIGPRGIGKTHFISLIYYRLEGQTIFHDNAVIAWLREEEWGISSFLDLLIRILRASLSYESHLNIAKQVEQLYELTPENAETTAKQLLEELVGNRTLIILMENLDEIFKGLGEDQKKLRAYLQNKPFCTILATSQSLFNGVSKQTSPFYGFFEIIYLDPLGLEDATKLLINIAEHKKDKELVSLISSPTGKARLRAIHHLAGGSHRVYIIFSEFLNSKSLDELVEPFMRTLDDLTPYYQSRLKDISPQQRKIIEYLCEERRAVGVKEIAQRCFMSHQTTSSHLKDLKDKGYVIATPVGRESYYELQEPLMRLCIEVKMHHDKPIRLFVDFLRFWYSSKDLETRLASIPHDAFERDYIIQAIETAKTEPNPIMLACLDHYKISMDKGDLVNALEAIEEIIAFQDQEQKDQKNKIKQAASWCDKGGILFKLKRYQEALNAFDKAIEICPFPLTWFSKGINMLMLNRYEEALDAFDKVIELDPNNTKAWLSKGATLHKLDRNKEALFAFDKTIGLNSNDAFAWFSKGITLHKLDRNKEALFAFDKAIGLNSNDAFAWLSKGAMLFNLNRYEDALNTFEHTIALNNKTLIALSLFGYGNCLLALNRWDEGYIALDKALSQYNTSQEKDATDTTGTIASIFNSTRDKAIWQTRIQKLVEIFDKNQAISLLGKGLVASIKLLISPMTNIQTAETWRDLWKAVVGERDELSLAFRFLNIAIEYYKTNKDRRVLLQLPIEEREILEEVLKDA